MAIIFANNKCLDKNISCHIGCTLRKREKIYVETSRAKSRMSITVTNDNRVTYNSQE